MLYPLIIFGGFWFWTWVVVISFFLLAWVEDTDASCAIGFLASIGGFYALSEPPVIGWEWIVTYLAIGIAFFLMVFRYRLGKLRNWLNKNPEFKDGKGGIYYYIDNDGGTRGRSIPSEMERIYQYEPSYVRFFDRVFCWPFSMLKLFFGEIVKDVFEWVANYLKAYKKRFLA